MRGITIDRQACPECSRSWGHFILAVEVDDDGRISLGTVSALLGCRSCDHTFGGTARVWELESPKAEVL